MRSSHTMARSSPAHLRPGKPGRTDHMAVGGTCAEVQLSQGEGRADQVEVLAATGFRILAAVGGRGDVAAGDLIRLRDRRSVDPGTPQGGRLKLLLRGLGDAGRRR